MAMTGTGLASKRKDDIITQFGEPTDEALLDSFLEIDSGAIVEYVQQNAKVKTGITVETEGNATAQTGETTSQGEIE